MRNPARRNRNIGTAWRGRGQNNKLVIPYPCAVNLAFHERLEQYSKEARMINGQRFLFVTEDTREGSVHACSVNDVADILSHVPPADYQGLSLIIFRQPKRKEELLSPVWGRLIYSYEFEGAYGPAIIIEARPCPGKTHWHKNLGPHDQQELARLRDDGHTIITDKRHHTIIHHPAAIRNTQLYRTLLLELGHYRQYLDVVVTAAHEEEQEKRWDAYQAIPQQEKETFAHRYAPSMHTQLTAAGVIPLTRSATSAGSI